MTMVEVNPLDFTGVAHMQKPSNVRLLLFVLLTDCSQMENRIRVEHGRFSRSQLHSIVF